MPMPMADAFITEKKNRECRERPETHSTDNINQAKVRDGKKIIINHSEDDWERDEK